MSAYDMTTDRIVHRASADTDYTIIIMGGRTYALVEEADDECIGYYQEIREGQYVYNKYQQYSYYVVDDDTLHSTYGEPDDMEILEVNDGDQEIAWNDGDIADLLGD